MLSNDAENLLRSIFQREIGRDMTAAEVAQLDPIVNSEYWDAGGNPTRNVTQYIRDNFAKVPSTSLSSPVAGSSSPGVLVLVAALVALVLFWKE